MVPEIGREVIQFLLVSEYNVIIQYSSIFLALQCLRIKEQRLISFYKQKPKQKKKLINFKIVFNRANQITLSCLIFLLYKALFI